MFAAIGSNAAACLFFAVVNNDLIPTVITTDVKIINNVNFLYYFLKR